MRLRLSTRFFHLTSGAILDSVDKLKVDSRSKLARRQSFRWIGLILLAVGIGLFGGGILAYLRDQLLLPTCRGTAECSVVLVPRAKERLFARDKPKSSEEQPLLLAG